MNRMRSIAQLQLSLTVCILSCHQGATTTVEDTTKATVQALAIADFVNASDSKELDAARKGLADMLITDLSDVPSLRVVERSRIVEVLREVDLNQTNYVDPQTAVKLGKLLGAKWLMTGALTAIQPQMRLDARVVDVQTGAVVLSEAVQGEFDKFFDVERQLAERLIKALNKNVQAHVASKGSPDAFIAYSKAVDAGDRKDTRAAEAFLQEAISRDPDYLAARRRLLALRSYATAVMDARTQEALDKLEKQLAMDKHDCEWIMGGSKYVSEVVGQQPGHPIMERLGRAWIDAAKTFPKEGAKCTRDVWLMNGYLWLSGAASAQDRANLPISQTTPDMYDREIVIVQQALDELRDTTFASVFATKLKLLADQKQQVLDRTEKTRSQPHVSTSGNGFLTVNSSPWAYVYIDGKKLPNSTPVQKYKVPAGPHKVRVESPGAGKSEEFGVVIQPGRTEKKVINFNRK